MKTLSFSIENLCVPCNCYCKHCLLDSKFCATGVSYDRAEAFARRFYEWLSMAHPEIGGMFYVGYCMDFPELSRWIAFVRERDPGFSFLQFNGLKIRNGEDLDLWLDEIKNNEIRMIDLTFFGLAEYHDRFAGRKGDFDYLIRILHGALERNIQVHGSICMNKANLDQLDSLLDLLKAEGATQYTFFLPHDKGRGRNLCNLRLTQDDFYSLSEDIRSHFVKTKHLTESQWLSRKMLPMPAGRNLTLSLTPENIDLLEMMHPETILRELEDMDDRFYDNIPALSDLANEYGNPANHQIFRWRDLVLRWQMQYQQDHPMNCHDMNDERYSFSIRTYQE